jgi:hypothetical protein
MASDGHRATSPPCRVPLMAQSGEEASIIGERETATQVTIAPQVAAFPDLSEVGVKNVEAQAHRAINDDSFLGVFFHLSIQHDDEHLSPRLWCTSSKPIFDLPSVMNGSTIRDRVGQRQVRVRYAAESE